MSKPQQLISTAFALFYQQGIHATGINQILEQAGVAKKTLYHHFPGKDDLLLAVLAYRDEVFSGWLLGRLDDAASLTELCRAWFGALDDWFNGRADDLLAFRGCFFVNTSAEYSDPQHPVQQACRAHKQGLEMALAERIAMRLEKISQEGKTDAQQLAHEWCLLKEGAIASAAVGGNLAAANDALTLALRHPLLNR
ncbi:TetR/AcrR family transcriptional regulator [Thalassolituus sp. LLYu03]|uniref:TetR/AcrR family transcriptional regulator n=1 Tax=Thalassolituus sp. LLYu03 TaxID=3421656 RepID=UPI003D2D05A2